MTYTLDPPLPPTPTPQDYHRLNFDPSNISSKRIVGLLACQRDPLLRSLRPTVLASRPASLAAPPPQRGKGNKRKPDPTPSTAEPVAGRLWEVEVEDTVIFPEGGGQPSDTGKLWMNDPNGTERSFVVEGCMRRKLDSVHLVRVEEKDEHLFDGLGGHEVTLEVDWERRQDHMSIHTAQHLLSAVLDRYDLPTLSWSLTSYPSLEPPYIELARNLTWAEAEEVEAKCNALIQEGKRVWVDVDMQEEGFVKMTTVGVRENRGIPTDYTDGVIRHIVIDGIDRNACCGTQVPHLSHCGFIHVIPPSTPSTATKPSSKMPTKLYFTAGPRAIRYLNQSSRTVSLASQAIGVGRDGLVERSAKNEEQRRELISREKEVKSELAKMIGDQAVRLAEEQGGVVWLQRTEKGTHEFDFLSNIATAFSQSELAKGLIIITSTPTATTQSLLLVQSKDTEIAKEFNEKLKSQLEDGEKVRVKGGGAKGRFISKIEGKWGKGEVARVQRVVEEYRDNGGRVSA